MVFPLKQVISKCQDDGRKCHMGMPTNQKVYTQCLCLAVVAALNLFAEGEPKMPTLNWMGREKATKSVKEVVMKILREDKSLPCGSGDNVLVHGDNLTWRR